MNPNTWISFLTTTIGAAASAAVTDGILTGNNAQALISVAGVAVPFIWGLFIHSDSKVVQTAGEVKGILPLRATSVASPEIQKLAMDPTVKTVEVAPPQPFVSSTISQRR